MPSETYSPGSADDWLRHAIRLAEAVVGWVQELIHESPSSSTTPDERA